MWLPRELATGDIQLSLVDETHLPGLFERVWNCQEVMLFQNFHRHTDVQDSLRMLRNLRCSADGGGDPVYTILRRGTVLGKVGLRTARTRLEVSFAIARQHWGEGIAWMAVSAVLQEAARVKRGVEFEAACHVDNARSESLLLRLGFERVLTVDSPGAFPNLPLDRRRQVSVFRGRSHYESQEQADKPSVGYRAGA